MSAPAQNSLNGEGAENDKGWLRSRELVDRIGEEPNNRNILPHDTKRNGGAEGNCVTTGYFVLGKVYFLQHTRATWRQGIGALKESMLYPCQHSMLISRNLSKYFRLLEGFVE